MYISFTVLGPYYFTALKGKQTNNVQMRTIKAFVLREGISIRVHGVTPWDVFGALSLPTILRPTLLTEIHTTLASAPKNGLGLGTETSV